MGAAGGASACPWVSSRTISLIWSSCELDSLTPSPFPEARFQAVANTLLTGFLYTLLFPSKAVEAALSKLPLPFPDMCTISHQRLAYFRRDGESIRISTHDVPIGKVLR